MDGLACAMVAVVNLLSCVLYNFTYKGCSPCIMVLGLKDSPGEVRACACMPLRVVRSSVCLLPQRGQRRVVDKEASRRE